MKFFFITCLAFITAAGILRSTSHQAVALPDINQYKKINSLGCSPDWNLLRTYLEESDIPPLPGAGKYQWDIRAKNDSAQFYFNQGINLYYGFHIIEAMASFKKAAKFENDNAGIWWAQALAYGPNINDVSYSVVPDALEAVKKATDFSQQLSPFGKALIEAMAVRYSTDTSLTREELNRRYTMAMQKIFLQYPTHADAAALYVDAMMLEHPWELWNINGTPKPWTPRIREVLEKGLARTPDHPGLNHYYIHVMEPSPFPEKAMASADRLGKLNPGVSHLVHMPSHIYLRTGQFDKGYAVNEEAVRQYKTYLSLFPAVIANEVLYRVHNEHMQINCGMHAGRKQYTIEASLSLQNSFDTSYLSLSGGLGNYIQYVYMIPSLAKIRFADWDGLLSQPAVDPRLVYATVLWRFGRGMAYAAKADVMGAEKESAAIESLLTDSSLYAPYTPFSPAIDGAVIASNMLKGTIARQKGNMTEAINAFMAAVEREKAMVYNEPRDWLLNPKNYLAETYAAAGNWKNAEKIFNDDLKDNNENVWSLAGLHKSLLQQNKNKEAASVLIRLKKASQNSDIKF